MSGYLKDVIVQHAMHIFQNLEFRPMSGVSREDQLKIKDALLCIYRDAATTDQERLIRQTALEKFREAHGTQKS